MTYFIYTTLLQRKRKIGTSKSCHFLGVQPKSKNKEKEDFNWKQVKFWEFLWIIFSQSFQIHTRLLYFDLKYPNLTKQLAVTVGRTYKCTDKVDHRGAYAPNYLTNYKLLATHM